MRFFDQHYVDLRHPGAFTAMLDRLIGDGLLFFDGIQDRRQFVALARSIATIAPHRDADEEGLTTLAGTEHDPKPGFVGLSTGELVPHTDGTSLFRPPTMVMLLCLQPSVVGGGSIFVDGAEVHRRLRVQSPGLLRLLQDPTAARFGEAGYEAPVFGTANGATYIRYRRDDLVSFSPQLGDSTAALARLVAGSAISVRLQAGQGYVIQNGRWLHGRVRSEDRGKCSGSSQSRWARSSSAAESASDSILACRASATTPREPMHWGELFTLAAAGCAALVLALTAGVIDYLSEQDQRRWLDSEREMRARNGP